MDNVRYRAKYAVNLRRNLRKRIKRKKARKIISDIRNISESSNACDISNNYEIYRSESDLSSENESESENSDSALVNQSSDLMLKLQLWKISHPGVTISAFNDVLKIFKNFYPGLPHEYRTIMKIKSCYEVRVKTYDNYDFILFNIKDMFSNMIEEMKRRKFPIPDTFLLQANTDGVSTENSTSSGYWTFLVSIVNLRSPIVLPVALTYGRGKPPGLSWLHEGLKLMKDILDNGVDGHQFKMEAFIQDLPAACYTKNINYFQSLAFPCMICKICAERSKKAGTQITQPSLANEYWTHEDFYNISCGNQKGDTPIIAELGSKMDLIRNFPPDPMHTIYLGIFSKYLDCLVYGLKSCRPILNDSQKIKMHEEILRVNISLPACEFQRLPRSIIDLSFWKASEFRVFLLYESVIVLKSVLSEYDYIHFLHLFVSISILETEELIEDDEMIAFAENLLLKFVKEGHELYGDSWMVIKTHLTLHLPQMVREFRKPLTNFSAFRFENFNREFSLKVRSGKKNITQFAKRFYEEISVTFFKAEMNKSKKKPITYFILGCYLHKVLHDEKQGLFRCSKFSQGQPLFVLPCDSRILKIFKTLKNPEEEVLIPQYVVQSSTRAIVISIDTCFLASIPLRHTC